MGKRHKPEEIIAKLRQVEVMTGQGTTMVDAIRLASTGSTRPASDSGGLFSQVVLQPLRSYVV